MTILDACVQVLGESGAQMSADQLFEEVQRRELFAFKAKDPKSVLRSALRKHVRSQSPQRVVQVSPGVYRKA